MSLLEIADYFRYYCRRNMPIHVKTVDGTYYANCIVKDVQPNYAILRLPYLDDNRWFCRGKHVKVKYQMVKEVVPVNDLSTLSDEAVEAEAQLRAFKKHPILYALLDSMKTQNKIIVYLKNGTVINSFVCYMEHNFAEGTGRFCLHGFERELSTKEVKEIMVDTLNLPASVNRDDIVNKVLTRRHEIPYVEYREMQLRRS